MGLGNGATMDHGWVAHRSSQPDWKMNTGHQNILAPILQGYPSYQETKFPTLYPIVQNGIIQLGTVIEPHCAISNIESLHESLLCLSRSASQKRESESQKTGASKNLPILRLVVSFNIPSHSYPTENEEAMPIYITSKCIYCSPSFLSLNSHPY